MSLMTSLKIQPTQLRSVIAAALPLVAAAANGDRHVVGLPETHGNTARLLVDTEQFVPAVLKDIAAAQKQVNVTMFSWQDDGAGRTIGEALKQKVKDGVEVNVLIDGLGSRQWPGSRYRKYIDELSDAGINVKRNWPTSAAGRDAVAAIDHRKIFEIDGRIAYLGGMNLAAKYDKWHDLMVRIEGPAAAQAGAELAGRWSDLGGKLGESRAAVLAAGATAGAAAQGKAGVKLLGNSPRGELAVTTEFFNMARTARKRLWVLSPYIGNKAMVEALADAARRGVDVRVAVPGPNPWKNGKIALKLTRAFYDDLVEAGVKVFEQPQMSHGKLWLSDDTANISSVNLDRRSAMFSYEIGATINDATFLKQVEQLFDRDFGRSRVVTAKETDQYRGMEILRKVLNLRV